MGGGKKMTLDEMLIETASYCDAEISKTGGAYTGDSLVTANKLLSSLNYALNKIYREKIQCEYTETITLDSNLEFDLTTLTKNMLRLLTLKDSDRNEYTFEIDTNSLYVPDGVASGTYSLKYVYLPSKLLISALTGTTELPSTVDELTPCYYAAYKYLSDDSDERASTYIDLYNDAMQSIKPDRHNQRRIRGRAY
jgi:hypothetical protein